MLLTCCTLACRSVAFVKIPSALKYLSNPCFVLKSSPCKTRKLFFTRPARANLSSRILTFHTGRKQMDRETALSEWFVTCCVKSPGSQTGAAVPVGLLIGRCLVVNSWWAKAPPNLSPPFLSVSSATRMSLSLLCFCVFPFVSEGSRWNPYTAVHLFIFPLPVSPWVCY